MSEEIKNVLIAGVSHLSPLSRDYGHLILQGERQPWPPDPRGIRQRLSIYRLRPHKKGFKLNVPISYHRPSSLR